MIGLIRIEMKRVIAFLFLVVVVFGCISPKAIVNFQAPEGDTATIFPAPVEHYIAIIQPADLLAIYVVSSSPDASKYFNYTEKPEEQSSMANCYLVDDKGMVRLPLVGDVHVAGLTSGVARDTLTHRLEKYLVNPSIKVSIRNFRVSVIGEVTHPGMVIAENEHLTLPEALASVGDMTVYAKRDNVTIIREVGGKKVYATVNMESREIFSSPYYELHANDIVYVPPMRTKKTVAETWYKVLPIVFSGISLALAVLAITK
jgi:polysaccharide export outer membrane protein